MKNTDKKTLRQRLRAKPQESEEYVRRGPNLRPQPEPDELEQPPEKPEYDCDSAPTEAQLVEFKTLTNEPALSRSQVEAYRGVFGGRVDAARGFSQAIGASASSMAEAMRIVGLDPAMAGEDQTIAPMRGNPRVERRNDGSVVMRVGEHEIVMAPGANGLMRLVSSSLAETPMTAQAQRDVEEEAERASRPHGQIAEWLRDHLPRYDVEVSLGRNNEVASHHSFRGERSDVIVSSTFTVDVDRMVVRSSRARDAVYLAGMQIPAALFNMAIQLIAQHYATATERDPRMPRGLHVFTGEDEWVLGIASSQQIFYYNVEGQHFQTATSQNTAGQRRSLASTIVAGYWVGR